ncbi:MAG: hypothetical protein ACE5DK_10300, partial [Paracoccaceae bacterium]
LCGSQDGLQRQRIKALLDGWEAAAPGRRRVMFRALMNARPSHLLDTDLFGFQDLALRADNSKQICQPLRGTVNHPDMS